MSKLYKIESLLCTDVYYGTTTKKYLSERMTYYRHEYKKYSQSKSNSNEFELYCNKKKEFGHESLLNLFQLFDKYNISNFKVNLIGELYSKSKDYAKSQLFHFIKVMIILIIAQILIIENSLEILFSNIIYYK
jgi:hypothetical protein